MDRTGLVSTEDDRRYEPVTAPEPATLPSEHERDTRSLIGKLLAPLVVLIGVVVKFSAFALKFFGVFLAVGGYALIWGWKFGVGFVLLILAHELGHYIEARRSGLNPQLPVFIPFIGAYVALRNMRFDPWVNARVSLAGPIAGGIAAAGCLAAAVALDSDLLRALAYAGFLLNLINLAPIAFLDGAHVLRSWRVLRAGGGRMDPTAARRLAAVVAVASLLTIAGLVLGMLAAHVPQDRL
jgi:Zn-dependent protease